MKPLEIKRKRKYFSFKLFILLLRKKYYKLHGIKIGLGDGGTCLPNLGKGKYVDVVRKGNIIEIYNHTQISNFKIRIIPYASNHGVEIEYVDENGIVKERMLLDASNLKNMFEQNNEREQC